MTSETHGAKRSSEPLDLRALIETIPALVVCASTDGSAEFTNRAWQEYTGRPLHQLTGSGWHTTIHPDDLAKFFHDSTVGLMPGKSVDTEARLRRADGQYRWFSIRKTLAVSRTQDREPSLCTLIACEDIEERKEEEFARRYSEKQYRLVVETASDAVISVNDSSAILFANPATMRVFGYAPTELIGKPLTILMPEFLGKLHDVGFKRYLATGQRHMNWQGTELVGLRKNGQEFPVEVSFGELTKNGHRVFTGFIRDISERKQAEEKLRRSEAYLTEAQRLSQTGSFGCNLSTGEMFWSEETFRIYGYDRSTQPAVERVLQRVHPDDKPLVQEQIDRASHGGKDCHVECRLLLPDDSVKHVRIVAHASKNDPGIIEFIGAVMDVTATKKAEEKLRRSEAYLAEGQKLSHTGSFGWDVSSGEIYWSRETFRIFEYEPTAKVTIELMMQRTHPEDRSAVQQLIERVSRERTDFDFEHRLLMADGSVKYLRVIGSPSENEDGCFEFVGAVTDITESKRAEEALRQSESYLAEAQRLTHTGSWVWEVEPRDAVHLSEEWYRIYRFDPAEGMPGWDKRLERIHPEDRARWQGVIERAIGQKSDYEIEYRILLPDGTVKYIHVVGHPVLDSSGEVLQFVGSSTDITERKRAEEKIRQSEEELRQLLDFTPQHVTVLGPDGRRLYNNQAALDYHGLTLEEWQTADADRLFHPQDWERITREVYSKFLSGSSHDVEVRLKRRDGQYRWFLIRYNPTLDEQGRPTRWYAAATDIEERKQAELRLQDENVALREEIDRASMFEEIVGVSPALHAVLSRVSKVAPTDSTVLITGETGTGKELVARAIHRRSHRSSRAFVSVNCAAVPRDLIASELFGHEKGAFTGATQRRLGRFELAEGGTIFLDEIGELPAETQIALLRVLQEHEFGRVGGTGSIRANVRVIAATNRDLEAAIAAGTFRSDLFYRLNVFPIEVPPLRERKEDIRLLVEYFIDRYASKAGKSIRGVNKKSLELLQSYPWPGNIRELQNVIERSVIVCDTENFSVDESWLSRQPPANEPKTHLEPLRKPAAKEKEIIEAALRESGGRVYGPSGAASKLGIPRSTLESKIRSLKISKSRFKAMDSSKNS